MPAARDVVLAIDLGTSSCKAALYSREGERLVLYSEQYPVYRDAPHSSEQDPEDYCQAAHWLTGLLMDYASEAHLQVVAVGFSTQTPTLVFCGEDGRAVGRAILWQDARAGEEAGWLLNNTTEADRLRWFGLQLPLAAATTPAKLLWMKRHAPDAWRAVRHAMQPKDFVAHRLTGRFTTDYWCAKGLANIQTGQMDPEFAALLDKPASLSPPVRFPGETAGKVTADASRHWGLPKGIPVSVGWSDAMAGILAAQAWHRPGGFILSGTSEIVGASGVGFRQDPGLFHVPASIFPLAGLSVHYGPTQAGGASLQWAADLLGRTPEEALNLLDARAPSGPSPVLFRPYLDGERAPYWNHNLTAGFEGLRLAHGPAELVYAVLQGVALQERLVLERAEADQPVSEIVVAGGGARDHRWNQIRANVLQRPIRVLQDAESSLRGAAMLAWGGISEADLKAPAGDWFRSRELLPDTGRESFYREMMDRFRKI